ncbi:MAG: hypothetical protein LBB45_03840 [Methanobrevibacter sp.]|jgi:hypothetical protein|nr:hypothetical protein [Candidatus Methanovirga basalitermitum]
MGKVRITDAKVNKKIIGDEVTYQKVSASKVNPTKGGKSGGRGKGGVDGNKKPKQPSFREVVLQFIEEQRQFNKKQEQFNDDVVATLKEHGEAIAQLNIKVDKIDNEVEKIEDRVENVIKLNNLES